MNNLHIKLRLYLLQYKAPLFVIALYLTALSFNVNKAFHNDDTFHLEAAKWIENNPLKPMSGTISWNQVHPIYNSNHPPLYYYFLSLSGSWFGYNEWSLHLFQSVFTLLVILFFFKVAQKVVPENAYFITALLILNPAFIPNQNLSIDLPIMAMHLMLMYYILKQNPTSFKAVIIMGIILSLAILIKYTTIALIPVFLVLSFKNRRLISVLIIPFITIIIWSIWNINEFGFIHIISREPQTFSFYIVIYLAVAYLLALGSFGPLSLLFLSIKGGIRPYIKAINIFLVLLFTGLLFGQLLGLLSVNQSSWMLWLVFLINGCLVVGMLFFYLIKEKRFLQIFKNQTEITLWLWFLALASFIILFTPFMATRHVLLALPAILLLMVYYLREIPFKIKVATLTLSFLLTFTIGLSDWRLADFYRKRTKSVADKYLTESKIFFTGQLGWQWYAQKEGMKKYNAYTDTIHLGDLFVLASKTSAAQLPDNSRFLCIEIITTKPGWRTAITTSGYYRSNARVLPWNINFQDADSIKIFRCTDVVYPTVCLNQ